jgi:hypothetical protein
VSNVSVDFGSKIMLLIDRLLIQSVTRALRVGSLSFAASTISNSMLVTNRPDVGRHRF